MTDQPELARAFGSPTGTKTLVPGPIGDRTIRTLLGSIENGDLDVLESLAAIEGITNGQRTLWASDDDGRISQVWQVFDTDDGDSRYAISISLDHDSDDGGVEIAFGVIDPTTKQGA